MARVPPVLSIREMIFSIFPIWRGGGRQAQSTTNLLLVASLPLLCCISYPLFCLVFYAYIHMWIYHVGILKFWWFSPLLCTQLCHLTCDATPTFGQASLTVLPNGQCCPSHHAFQCLLIDRESAGLGSAAVPSYHVHHCLMHSSAPANLYFSTWDITRLEGIEQRKIYSGGLYARTHTCQELYSFPNRSHVHVDSYPHPMAFYILSGPADWIIMCWNLFNFSMPYLKCNQVCVGFGVCLIWCDGMIWRVAACPGCVGNGAAIILIRSKYWQTTRHDGGKCGWVCDWGVRLCDGDVEFYVMDVWSFMWWRCGVLCDGDAEFYVMEMRSFMW